MTPVELAFLLRRDYQTLEGEPLPVVVEQERVVAFEARPQDRPALEGLGVEVR